MGAEGNEGGDAAPLALAPVVRRFDDHLGLDCRSLESEVVDLGFAAAALELLTTDTGGA